LDSWNTKEASTSILQNSTHNVYGSITGEDLQKKINMAMPDSILDMWFNKNEEDFVNDKDFLQSRLERTK
jgi:hypothetical protein